MHLSSGRVSAIIAAVRWVFAAAVLAGCYSPHPQPGAPCSSNGCPDGLVCSPATMTCELHAIDAATTIDTPLAIDARVDAPVDGRPIDAPMPQPTLVQQGVNYADQATSLSVTLPNLPGANHVLVMIGGNPHAHLDSVTGGGVTTWTFAAGSWDNANIEIWYGVSNGSNATVTITCATNTLSMALSVSEWSGLATTNLLDTQNAIGGVVSPAKSGSITTTNAHDLLLFGVGDDAPNTFGNPAPGTWTQLTPVTGFLVQGEWYRIVSATGTYTPTVSETANSWDGASVALRAM